LGLIVAASGLYSGGGMNVLPWRWLA